MPRAARARSLGVVVDALLLGGRHHRAACAVPRAQVACAAGGWGVSCTTTGRWDSLDWGGKRYREAVLRRLMLRWMAGDTRRAAIGARRLMRDEDLAGLRVPCRVVVMLAVAWWKPATS